MAQAKVTEYFASRKRPYDVVQPRKKVRLDTEIDDILEKVSRKLDTVKPRPAPSSASRQSKKTRAKQQAGSITKFLLNVPRSDVVETVPIDNVSTHSDSHKPASSSNKKAEVAPISELSDNKPGWSHLKRSLNKKDVKNHEVNTHPNLQNLVPMPVLKSNIENSCKNIESLSNSVKQVANPSFGSSMEKMNYVVTNRQDEKSTANPKLSVKSSPLLNFDLNKMKDNCHSNRGQNIQIALDAAKHISQDSEKRALLQEKITNFKAAKAKLAEPVKPEFKEPAFERFHSLSDKEVETSLVLPFKYRVLFEVFRNVETVVGMLFNRKEVCTFEKLKESVQRLGKRALDKNVLGQIATVFPTAYNFQLDRNIKSFVKCNTNVEQLTITPNLGPESQDANKQQMHPSIILKRRKIFHNSLIRAVMQHHQSFLLKLKPPIHIPADQIVRWHPKFLIENVPDIVASSLPEPEVKKVSTAQDVLERMQGGVNERMEKALLSVIEKQKLPPSQSSSLSKIKKDFQEGMEKALPSVVEKPLATQSSTPLRVASGPLKGISQALLNKIKQKESMNLVRDMTRKPESEKKIEMLSRLPELVRILRTLFIAEKRAAIALMDVNMKVSDSLRSSISPEDVEAHLKLLLEVVPKWITFVTVTKGVFMKIDKNKEVSEIVRAIDDAVKKEKC